MGNWVGNTLHYYHSLSVVGFYMVMCGAEAWVDMAHQEKKLASMIL